MTKLLILRIRLHRLHWKVSTFFCACHCEFRGGLIGFGVLIGLLAMLILHWCELDTYCPSVDDGLCLVFSTSTTRQWALIPLPGDSS